MAKGGFKGGMSGTNKSSKPPGDKYVKPSGSMGGGAKSGGGAMKKFKARIGRVGKK